MANAVVQVQPDSSGKKIQTFENVVGGATVESQGVALVDTTSTPLAMQTSAVAGSELALVVRAIPSSTLSQLSQRQAASTGGATLGHARNLNATVVSIKGSAGTLYGLQILNNQGADAYVQVFNVTSGAVVLSTTDPDLEFRVTANTQMNVPLPDSGTNFGTAISIASTTAEKGATNSANGVMAFYQYA